MDGISQASLLLSLAALCVPCRKKHKQRVDECGLRGAGSNSQEVQHPETPATGPRNSR